MGQAQTISGPAVGDRVVTASPFNARTHDGRLSFPAGLAGEVTIAPFVDEGTVYVKLDNGWSAPFKTDDLRGAGS